MIQCPFCQATQVDNTIFCGECGHCLLPDHSPGTDPLDMDEINTSGDKTDGTGTAQVVSSASGPLTIRFKMVLFLQALVLEGGPAVVLSGVALGLAGAGLVGLVTFGLQTRLPYKKMLIVTGMMIGGVLLVMVGNTVHVLQVVGWLPIHVINTLPLPYWAGLWLGMYPTWEGLLLQAGAAVFVIGSYYLAEWHKKQRHSLTHSPQVVSG